MEDLKTSLSNAESQYNLFNEKKTIVCGTRCRADLLAIQKKCGALRKSILAETKAIRLTKKKSKPHVNEVPKVAVTNLKPKVSKKKIVKSELKPTVPVIPLP